ncbi:MAG: DPP IV N-terminal domain-containing protein, partial [Candidatus Riflebacteria bacterium]|nr:DPP IV N-terminal domain-containing protein [Candidatus Riflebacteria bacterium]
HSFLGVFSGTGFYLNNASGVADLGGSTAQPAIEPSIVYKTASDSSETGLTPASINENLPVGAASPSAMPETAVSNTGEASQPASLNETTASISSETAVLNDAASQTANTPDESNSAAEASSVNAVPAVFPPGRLVYKKTIPLEKAAGNNYHGFMARDGSELIFSSNRQQVNGQSLYQCFSKKPSADSAATRVFEWPGNVWTPETTVDNNMVVFSSDSARPEHIFIYDRKTRNSMPLTTGGSKNMMPAISPDGKLIAFVSNRKGSNNIWLIGIEGANLMQITTGTADDREPRWSPDGLSLYFTRIIEPLKKSHIMKVLLEPLGEPVAVVDTPNRNWLADMSPDGNIIAYTRSESTDGSKNVLVLREMASGKEEVLKPLGGAECYRPVWNADCSGFVFHSSSSQGRTLHLAGFARETN